MTVEEWLKQLFSNDDPLSKQILQNSLELMEKGRIFGGTFSNLSEKNPQKKPERDRNENFNSDPER